MKTSQKNIIKESKKEKQFIDSSVWIELYLKERKVEEVNDYIGRLKNKEYIPCVNLIVIGEVIKAIRSKSKDVINHTRDFLDLLDLLDVRIVDINHNSIYSTYNEIYDNSRVSKKDSMDVLSLSSAHNNGLKIFITIEDIDKPIWNDNYIKGLIKIRTL